MYGRILLSRGCLPLSREEDEENEDEGVLAVAMYNIWVVPSYIYCIYVIQSLTFATL